MTEQLAEFLPAHLIEDERYLNVGGVRRRQTTRTHTASAPDPAPSDRPPPGPATLPFLSARHVSLEPAPGVTPVSLHRGHLLRLAPLGGVITGPHRPSLLHGHN